MSLYDDMLCKKVYNLMKYDDDYTGTMRSEPGGGFYIPQLQPGIDSRHTLETRW